MCTTYSTGTSGCCFSGSFIVELRNCWVSHLDLVANFNCWLISIVKTHLPDSSSTVILQRLVVGCHGQSLPCSFCPYTLKRTQTWAFNTNLLYDWKLVVIQPHPLINMHGVLSNTEVHDENVEDLRTEQPY